ncbi:hypothetical protein Ancab_000639 [Ancistrocladus abbreviatus]
MPNSAKGAAPFLLVSQRLLMVWLGSIAHLFAISVQPHYRHPSPIVICTTRMPTTLQSRPTPAIRILAVTHVTTHSLGWYCRLLNLLANAKLYPKIKWLLNDFVAKKEGHSNSSIFHALSMVDDWFCGNSVLVDMLILAYVKNLKVDLAAEAFKLVGHYGVELSINSRHPMLAALVDQVINGLCKVRKLQKARDLMGDMKVWGISPTVVMYNTLINGYWKKGNVGRMYKADALMKEMLSKKICPNEITYNTLINGFCKDENLLAAVKVFKDMEMQDLKADVPNIVTYSALINGYSKKGMLKEARELFDDAARQGLAPTAVTFGG